jgi:hypothetical protein
LGLETELCKAVLRFWAVYSGLGSTARQDTRGRVYKTAAQWELTTMSHFPFLILDHYIMDYSTSGYTNCYSPFFDGSEGHPRVGYTHLEINTSALMFMTMYQC